MAIAGALIGGAIGAFGSKPKVPTLQDINVNQVQSQTVQGNISNFGDIAKLAASVNTFNQDQLNALIDRALPGARDQIEKNIGSQLRGELPQDVVNQITRYQAGRNAGSLTSGSGFAGNNAARQLGLTSLNLIDKGLSSAESWLQRAAAPQMDVTSMFFTPQQRLAFEQQQQGVKFQRDLMAAEVAAAPDPATAALGKEIDRFFNTAASVGMMAAGGGMGGGGGGLGMSGSKADLYYPATGSTGGGGGMFGGPGNGGGNMQAAGAQYGMSNWLNYQTNAGSANGGHL